MSAGLFERERERVGVEGMVLRGGRGGGGFSACFAGGFGGGSVGETVVSCMIFWCAGVSVSRKKIQGSVFRNAESRMMVFAMKFCLPILRSGQNEFLGERKLPHS